MVERKWGAITSGSVFEALATGIVFFEDSRSALFGRRGKDGGQDARSGDGTRVFQAKYHENGSAAAAIRDAKREASKVAEYRKPHHERYDQWKGVTHWQLVTNASFNPTDRLKWDSEVVPLFKRQGLDADYWERENLNALLDKHPELHRSYFENETRVFVSLPEIVERLAQNEPFLRRNELAPFAGRSSELESIREFLASDKLFLVLHGAGGIGKTRLLVEAGLDVARRGDWQVLWANVESMATTGSWFAAVVPERATMLLVDEPTQDAVLQQLAEQFRGGRSRGSEWKIVVAVGSSRDPVLRFLRSARLKMHVEELRIAPLSFEDAESISFQLLKSGKLAHLREETLRDAAGRLSRQFGRYPVWLTLAIQQLEEHGNLALVATTSKQLADEYLADVERSQSDIAPEAVRTLLLWLSLLGPIDRNDTATIQYIGNQCGEASTSEIRTRIVSLVKRGALVERGLKNRFIEVKPDVVRDHVLTRWLAADVGAGRLEVSDDCKLRLDRVLRATLDGELGPLDRALLTSLARAESILRQTTEELKLFGGFFESLKREVPMLTASQRPKILEAVDAIANHQPQAVVSLVRALRMSEASSETIHDVFGPKELAQADVVLELASPLFKAAMSAQLDSEMDSILRELCDLVEAEAELSLLSPRGLPNDGKRAAAYVRQVIAGGPQFWGEYDTIAARISTELIDKMSVLPATGGRLRCLIHSFRQSSPRRGTKAGSRMDRSACKWSRSFRVRQRIVLGKWCSIGCRQFFNVGEVPRGT